MSHDLASLPIEILIGIVESESPGKFRLRICEALRLSCKEINDKLVRYYGVEFFKRITLSLNQIDLAAFHRLSQGPLAGHIQSIEIDCSTVVSLRHSTRTAKSEWSDCEAEHSSDPISTSKKTPDVLHPPASALLYGACSKFLSPALTKLSNLKEFHVSKGRDHSVATNAARDRLRKVWSMVVQVLFTMALSQACPLEVLAADTRLPLYVSASILQNLVICSAQRSALTRLRLNVGFDGTGANLKRDVYLMKNLVVTSPNLTDFYIGFDGSTWSDDFFELFSSSCVTLRFRRVSLSYLRTSEAAIRRFLLSCRNNLQAVTLDCVTVHIPSQKLMWGLPNFLATQFHLKEVKLRCCNIGQFGVLFKRISRKRPICLRIGEESILDEDEWIMVCNWPMDSDNEIVLDVSEGDDIKYWLGQISHFPHFYSLPWPWS